MSSFHGITPSPPDRYGQAYRPAQGAFSTTWPAESAAVLDRILIEREADVVALEQARSPGDEPLDPEQPVAQPRYRSAVVAVLFARAFFDVDEAGIAEAGQAEEGREVPLGGGWAGKKQDEEGR